MGGLFGGRGGLAGLASPLSRKIDPVGNATSDALFGKEKEEQQKKVAVAASTENKQQTTSAGDALGIEDEEKKRTLGMGSI
jgi:hypothetical protein